MITQGQSSQLKELLIRVGHSPDELGKEVHVCVMGVDKTTGISYVLHTGIERV